MPDFSTADLIVAATLHFSLVAWFTLVFVAAYVGGKTGKL